MARIFLSTVIVFDENKTSNAPGVETDRAPVVETNSDDEKQALFQSVCDIVFNSCTSPLAMGSTSYSIQIALLFFFCNLDGYYFCLFKNTEQLTEN